MRDFAIRLIQRYAYVIGESAGAAGVRARFTLTLPFRHFEHQRQTPSNIPSSSLHARAAAEVSPGLCFTLCE